MQRKKSFLIELFAWHPVTIFVLLLQESEIVEVLWKQDVDLGYSLSPPKPLDVEKPTVNADDENEKLRALQELKDDKVVGVKIKKKFLIPIFRCCTMTFCKLLLFCV